jgi:cell division inhibitor SepF
MLLYCNNSQEKRKYTKEAVMGFFDKILKAVGFEDSEAESKIKEKKDKKEKNLNVNSKFDLKNYEEKNEDLLRVESCFNPSTQEDVEVIARSLIKGENARVDFSAFNYEDKKRALDFLSGVVFALDGEIEKLEGSIYLLKNKE